MCFLAYQRDLEAIEGGKCVVVELEDRSQLERPGLNWLGMSRDSKQGRSTWSPLAPGGLRAPTRGLSSWMSVDMKCSHVLTDQTRS